MKELEQYFPSTTKIHQQSNIHQTIFIVLVSSASVAFVFIISLILCKFQCQIGSVTPTVKTVTSSSSPLSARALVQMSLGHLTPTSSASERLLESYDASIYLAEPVYNIQVVMEDKL